MCPVASAALHLRISMSALPDLPEISVSHVNLTVREGENAVITCNGSGSPLPDVDWTVADLHSINTHQVGPRRCSAAGCCHGWDLGFPTSMNGGICRYCGVQ